MATVALGLLVGVGVGLGAGGPAPDALRDLALRPPLHLPGDRARVRAPVRDRRRLRRPRRCAAVVGAVRDRRRRCCSGTACGHADPFRGAAPAARRRACVEENHRGRVGVPDRTRRGPAAAPSRRAVLPLALPHPRPVVGGEPVLAVGRSRAGTAADHRQDRRAAQRGAARCGPARACSPKDRTARSPRRVAGAGTVLLVGAGVGITPLRALFESLPGRPGDITLDLPRQHGRGSRAPRRDRRDRDGARRAGALPGRTRDGAAGPIRSRRERLARLVPDLRDARRLSVRPGRR